MADQLTQYFKNNILKYIKQMELDGKFSTGEEIVTYCAPSGCNYQQSINMCLPLLIELEREKKIKRAIMGGIPSFRVREERMSEEMKEEFREMEAIKDHTEEMTNDDIDNFNKMVKKIKAADKPSLSNKVFITSSKRSGEWSVPVDVITRHHARKYAYFFGGDIERCLKKYSLPFFVSDSIVIKYANRYMIWSDVADYAVKIEEEKIGCLPTHKEIEEYNRKMDKEYEKSWMFFNGIPKRRKRSDNMSVYHNACEKVLEILNQEVNIYQMPHQVYWAFDNCGFVSDGYSSKEEATIAALETIIDAAKKEIPA